jgi:acylphosphatase
VAETEKPIREDSYYHGRVQGVGFRDTTRRIAKGYPVTGFVENMPDGTVRLVVEGQRDRVTAFLKELATTMRKNIEHVETDEQPATGEFKDFSIRR